MFWWERLIIFYIISHVFVVLGLSITDGYGDNGFAWLNPLFIYRYAKVNWFGAGFIALVANAAFPIIAIIYWMYKLCTVGRRY